MKYPVYNQEGKEAGEMTLPKEIFEVQMNSDLVHQVFVSQNSNMRQNSAHTKNRGEVRGGGRKEQEEQGMDQHDHPFGLEEEFQEDQETRETISEKFQRK